MSKYNPPVKCAKFIFSLSCLLSGVAHSANLAGFTQSETTTFNAIDAHCANTRSIFNSLGPEQQQWSDSCWELVTTFNKINNTGGPTGFANPAITTNAQLAMAVQESSQQTVLSQARGAIESATGQFANIGSRLEAVRLGVTGLNLAGLNLLNKDGTQVASSDYHGRPVRGGGASGDGLLDEKFGGFLNGNFVIGDRDATDRQDGFDFDAQSVTAGLDYRFTDAFITGLALGYASSNVDIDSAGGGLETDSYSISSFSTYYTDRFFIDAIFSYTWTDYDSERTIVYPSTNTTAFGNTDGTQYSVAVGSGYNFAYGSLSVSPYARLAYVNSSIDGYSEDGTNNSSDLIIRDQRIESLISSFGARVNYSISTSIGVFVPQIFGEWQHEYQNNVRRIRARYRYDPFNTEFGLLTDTPDRDYFTLGTSLSGIFKHGVSGFISFQSLVGRKRVTAHIISAGARVEF